MLAVNSYIDSRIKVAQTHAFWDPARLQQLKINSKDPESLKTAAKEFASLMFHMMIKSMRDAQKSFKTDLCSSTEFEHYTELMDQQWAVHLAHTENNQLVDTIVQQFTKNYATDVDVASESSDAQTFIGKEIMPDKSMPYHSSVKVFSPIVAPQQEKVSASVIPTNTISEFEERKNFFHGEFAQREDFINKLLPYAIKVAQSIGMDPKLLLAQAALETSWGKKIAKFPNGESSYNLFGIKANNDWNGKKVASKTIEYSSGIAQRKVDWFRAYHGFEDSMQDYAKLINNSIRYRKSMESSHTPEQYTQALQDAGFATDPNYAKKIMHIYKGL